MEKLKEYYRAEIRAELLTLMKTNERGKALMYIKTMLRALKRLL